MRAKEFIIEEKVGKISKRHQQATKGLNVFPAVNWDRGYDLNRVMMAVAATDGSFVPDMDGESWIGKRNTAHAYTDVEQQMLIMAYKATGIKHIDINKGDLDSKELESTNDKSPIKPFKGYKK